MRTVSTPLRPAVFLDRDGTINRECHYLQRIDDFELLPGAPEALRKLQAAGFLLVVVTNQSGVARGYFSFETVTEINRHMQAVLAESGVVLDGIYVCPHHPTAGDGPLTRSCTCRKGSPGLLLQAAADLSIDLPRSWLVTRCPTLMPGVQQGVARLRFSLKTIQRRSVWTEVAVLTALLLLHAIFLTGDRLFSGSF